MTFAQLSARLKNFLRGWLLVLGLKEGLVECATVCVKSVVILLYVVYGRKMTLDDNLSLKPNQCHSAVGGIALIN